MCNFAHGEQDLRPVPPEGEEILARKYQGNPRPPPGEPSQRPAPPAPGTTNSHHLAWALRWHLLLPCDMRGPAIGKAWLPCILMVVFLSYYSPSAMIAGVREGSAPAAVQAAACMVQQR